MINSFVILDHSKILGTNLNAENGEISIILAENAHSETVLWMPGIYNIKVFMAVFRSIV